jgi:hypothetical protein
MMNVLGSAIGHGKYAKNPNSTLGKFMIRIAPNIPSVSYKLGIASVFVGGGRLVYNVWKFGIWQWQLFTPWAWGWCALFVFGYTFSAWDGFWWRNLARHN